MESVNLKKLKVGSRGGPGQIAQCGIFFLNHYLASEKKDILWFKEFSMKGCG